MTSIQEFVREHDITMTAEWADSNPNMPDSANMDHWKVTFKRRNVDGQRRQLTTYFSMGYGHNGREPKAEDVLDCLASDASGYHNARSFEDWASEYGYDEDSRTAERIYKTIERQANRLERFLGSDALNDLMWNTERE